jgi:hypothetical protein
MLLPYLVIVYLNIYTWRKCASGIWLKRNFVLKTREYSLIVQKQEVRGILALEFRVI